MEHIIISQRLENVTNDTLAVAIYIRLINGYYIIKAMFCVMVLAILRITKYYYATQLSLII